ncbi:sigma-70 family RNA polymerase sigma factor [Paludisphaera rhizosphaerae]|uniref:sigma-70 family RNA polymerase sigma factor n=1 Tax=Paludisphaera rhizosphaerae TaxID=2711216 RepID=UPI0013E9B6BF|nr:sigma-70 family RNA polymerase sigma factor [Paludisphaera rhizosphaerae]
MLEEARRGDPEALGRLLENYRGRLRAAADRRLGAGQRTRIAPSDVVQETFLKASRDFDRFVGDDRAFLGWLLRILENRLADEVQDDRRISRRRDLQGPLDSLLGNAGFPLDGALTSQALSPSEGTARRERRLLLAEAVDRLPADYREVYQLRTVQHLPFEDVAGRMGRSPGAVRILWTRALERLSTELRGRP